MRDDNCIFCKILAGDIPSYKVFEDDEFMVILDAGPATRGHALIIPKEHYRDLYAMPEELAAKAFVLGKKLIVPLKKILGAAGYNLVQNNGEAAGQTVPHFHLHLIPRYPDDNSGMGWNMGTLEAEEAQTILKEIKEDPAFE
ncbi:MAG: HIT family protein [Lachnospiraceae bacterium]|nr:HIT family protein [Lachnospiraceae bacterium]